MKNKETAVEWLIEHIKLDAMYEAKSIDEWVNIFEQAKAMEKEQIKDAWKDSNYHRTSKEVLEYSSNEYYEETYGAQLPKE